MRASERDRDYFRRIGELKAESHRQATAAHRALSIAERMRRSWSLSRRVVRNPSAGPFDDGALELYERAKALGLYEP